MWWQTEQKQNAWNIHNILRNRSVVWIGLGGIIVTILTIWFVPLLRIKICLHSNDVCYRLIWHLISQSLKHTDSMLVFDGWTKLSTCLYTIYIRIILFSNFKSTTDRIVFELTTDDDVKLSKNKFTFSKYFIFVKNTF